MYADSRVAPRTDKRGWLPPKAKGKNLKFKDDGGQPVTKTFYYNRGSQPRQLEAKDLPIPSPPVYSTFSVYHGHSLFFAVPYDACANQVHDGSNAVSESHPESEGSNSDEEDVDAMTTLDDWQELRFNKVHPTLRERYPDLSYADAGGPHLRLLAQRPDQFWAKYLLTDRYQRSSRMTQDKSRGGLVGKLSLLIALVVMALPPDQWRNVLPHVLTISGSGTWRVPPGISQVIPRGTLWRDGRGVVVTVYSDPKNPRGSSRGVLESFERGFFGPIFA
ncbi:hypothetical protein AC579_10436 [Pseudocercospora musae]|uniref:Uncharacterized protein n=1 Tax=Pseudocercospora musae TaxID=113226 RepID=A0A139ILE3_9PEZI|nr:hypothetical protein AC579_10436 [Pseudocercospora musae]